MTTDNLSPENVFVCQGHQKGIVSGEIALAGYGRCIVCVKNEQARHIAELERRLAHETVPTTHEEWKRRAFVPYPPPTDELAEAKLDIKTLLAICRDQENEIDTVDNDFPAGARRAIAKRWFPVEPSCDKP